MIWYLAASFAFATVPVEDPLEVGELLASSEAPEGWVCASACLGPRCGYICEGPTFDIPEPTLGWGQLGMRWGYVVRHEVHGDLERSRITYAAYDDILRLPLRRAVDAALARARAAAGRPALW